LEQLPQTLLQLGDHRIIFGIGALVEFAEQMEEQCTA
jgi:hypothetical protein